MLLSLAKQIIGILGFQIETERVFSLTGVLIALRCFRLHGENLDRIFIMVKNQLDDSHMNCKANASFKDYIKFEVTLIEKNYEFI
jgi:hypothetical protein